MITFPGAEKNPTHGSTKAFGERREINAAPTLATRGGEAEALAQEQMEEVQGARRLSSNLLYMIAE